MITYRTGKRKLKEATYAKPRMKSPGILCERLAFEAICNGWKVKGCFGFWRRRPQCCVPRGPSLYGATGHNLPCYGVRLKPFLFDSPVPSFGADLACLHQRNVKTHEHAPNKYWFSIALYVSRCTNQTLHRISYKLVSPCKPHQGMSYYLFLYRRSKTCSGENLPDRP